MATEPEEILERLHRMAPSIRALVAYRDGKQLAATSEGEWEAGWAELWRQAERDPTVSDSVEKLHIGVESGEVFALRQGELGVLAITDRLALASLVFWDLRAVLRELAGTED